MRPKTSDRVGTLLKGQKSENQRENKVLAIYITYICLKLTKLRPKNFRQGRYYVKGAKKQKLEVKTLIQTETYQNKAQKAKFSAKRLQGGQLLVIMREKAQKSEHRG